MNTEKDIQVEHHVALGTEPDVAAKRAHALWWNWVLLVSVLAVAAYVLLPRITQGQPRTAPATGRGGRMDPPIVPVVAVVASRADVPVYLNGLGTVTALNMVTVRSRVDGQLMTVNFREGQLVRKGDVLAQIDPRPYQVQLMQAEGQLSRDEATLKNAQMDLARYQALYAQDAIPKQQLDTAAAAVNQTEGVLKSDQAAIDNAKLNLTYSRITAPVTGRVGLRLVDPGNIVHASDPNGLVTITERQPIAVVFTIAEDSLPPVLQQLHTGRQLNVEAWDRDLTTKLATGKLLTVDNAIDPSTGTVRLKAEFANEDETLFPNQFVNARLLLDTLHDIVVVPAAAIQRNQQSTYVYVVKPDRTVELRTVDVRLTESDTSAVDNGLAPGETVVIEGVDKLQPGMKVAARMPAANGNQPRPGRSVGAPATTPSAPSGQTSPGVARRRMTGRGNQ